MLRVIPVEPELEPLLYYAVYAPTRQGSLARLVAETAGEVSNFPRAASTEAG
jgi:hypothetical protein